MEIVAKLSDVFEGFDERNVLVNTSFFQTVFLSFCLPLTLSSLTVGQRQTHVC